MSESPSELKKKSLSHCFSFTADSNSADLGMSPLALQHYKVSCEKSLINLKSEL